MHCSYIRQVCKLLGINEFDLTTKSNAVMMFCWWPYWCWRQYFADENIDADENIFAVENIDADGNTDDSGDAGENLELIVTPKLLHPEVGCHDLVLQVLRQQLISFQVLIVLFKVSYWVIFSNCLNFWFWEALQSFRVLTHSGLLLFKTLFFTTNHFFGTE